MSNKKYIQQTLTLPSSLPLFNYNINFEGLRHLMQTVNLQTNSNTEQIGHLKQQLETKLDAHKLFEQEQMLNGSLRLGLGMERLWTKLSQGKEDAPAHGEMGMFGGKMAKVLGVLEHLVEATQTNTEMIEQSRNGHQKNIDESFRRIDEKVTSTLDSLMKNVNLYFSQTNKKVASLESELHSHKRESTATFQTINNTLTQKVSEIQLKAALSGVNQQVKSSVLSDLSDDQLKRMATLNEYETKLKEHIKECELKIKAAKQTVKELSDKVVKFLPLQAFEVEKHKIFERLSQYKNKIDDLGRKNQEFIDFRKVFYENNEKNRNNFIQVEEQIKKLKEKGSSFKKMEDIGSILQNLDPHLICQIGSEVKLHQKQIGKLEKQVIYLQNELQSSRGMSNRMPQINSGQNSELITKIIKEYMSNLDFEGRVKKIEKQVYDIGKKNDSITDLEKKVYLLGKEINPDAIFKELKRKSDEEATRRDFKIADTKIQKLFDFYKQLRKDLEESVRKSRTLVKQSNENFSVTTKKLYSPNCLSCAPRQRPSTTRNYSRSRVDMSMDESIEQGKMSFYLKGSNL